MNILGIESSCDDTSVALIKASEKGFVVISEKTASQVEVHKKYGGVVPEVAGRCHAENILPVIEEVMKGQEKPGAIATTSGPGLITGLLVGIEAGKSLSYLWDVPLAGINHIEGHIYSVLLNNQKIEFPVICLIVSGGHTELILMTRHGEYKKIGATRDDAAGECFDKVAKLLGFDYPGGPKISKTAKKGNNKAVNFPRPMIDSNNLDFSFSGLKTAALYHKQDNPDTDLPDFCASFEQAIVDILIYKTKKAIEMYKPKSVILAGGVSANPKLRKELGQAFDKTPLLLPDTKYTMDNAAMIAVAGYFHAKKKDYTPWKEIVADPNWKVYQN